METEVFISIITAIILILFLAVVFILSIVRYRKRMFIVAKEKQLLQVTFSQQLLQSQLEIQDQTFNIISQEIHDNVGQILSLAKVQLNILEQGEMLDKGLLADTKDCVSKAMTDLRDIAKSLNSERIQSSTLPETLSQELNRISRLGLLSCQLDIQGKERNIPDQKKLILFRIIQETLQNILKHSKARNISVNCIYSDDYLQIEIADNGTGFDTNTLTQRDGLGLQNITKRAALLGGNAHIESAINAGTKITIITPYV